MEWLTTAQNIPLNTSRKIVHCGSSPSLQISSSLKGWTAYCHRCHWKAYEKRNSMPSAEEIAAGKLAVLKMRESKSLPSDFSTDFVMEEALDVWAVTWLATAGITASLRSAYSIGISSAYRACILPVGNLGFIARRYDHYLSRSGPKYVEAIGQSESAVFLSLAERAMYTDQMDVSGVLVEDVLSAIKCGEVLPGVSLLGTSLGYGKLESAINHCGSHKPIGIWTDPDKAGAQSGKAIKARLDLMGVKSVFIHSDKDPKKYSVRQIRRILGDRTSVPADYEAPAGLHSSVSDGSRGLMLERD